MLREAERREQAHTPDFRLKRGEICPGDRAAVLARSRTGQRSAFVMRWGFGLDKRLVFNARSESASDKPMFRDSMRQRRCLVPASGYFEWDHREPKPPRYLFAPEEGGMMFMAGLYRPEASPVGHAFTILTRDAAPELAPFHPRMPVILTGEYAAQWLDHGQSALPLLDHADASLMWQLA